MKEIVIISGKGGTGKTSLSACFSVLAGEKAIVADCDVDAADMHLLMEPDFKIDEDFYSGELAVISQESGKPYLTARKTSIPCTFEDDFAKTMLGKELPGEIQRMECEAYEYEIPGSKQKIKLTHTYIYSAEPATLEETVMG